MSQAELNSRPPLVSVIVPAYQAAWSIRDTLRSIAAQTYPHLEVIVVDDGSTDGTAEIVQSFALHDPRIRLLRQANGGVASARNRGVREAKGFFVAPIDADDLWAPTNLQRQMEALLAAGLEASMSFAETAYVDLRGRRLPAGAQVGPEPRVDFEGLLRRNLVGNGSAAVMRRSLVLLAGGYDESLHARGAQGAEDWKLTLKLATLGRVVMVRERLVYYRVNPNGMSHCFDAMRRSVLTVIEEARAFAPPGVPEQAYRDARSLLALWMLPRALRAKRWSLAAELAVDGYVKNPGVLRQPEPAAVLADLARGVVKKLSPPTLAVAAPQPAKA
jgi:glycosyltransferase involved in cell wall biosynthesis